MSQHSPVIEHHFTTSNLANLIKDRRTIRKFDNKDVSSPLLHQLLHDATALTIEPAVETPFRFMLATTTEEKNLAASIMMNTYADYAIYKWVPNKILGLMADRIEKIPVIGINLFKKGENQETYDHNFALTSAAVHNFSLLLWEHDLGMVWGTGDVFQFPSFRNGLRLQDDEEVHSIVYIGYYIKKPKAKQRTEAAKKLTKLS